jgi:hypothetical protein
MLDRVAWVLFPLLFVAIVMQGLQIQKLRDELSREEYARQDVQNCVDGMRTNGIVTCRAIFTLEDNVAALYKEEATRGPQPMVIIPPPEPLKVQIEP